MMQWALQMWINKELTNQDTINKILERSGLSGKISNKPFELVIPPVFTRIDVMTKMARYNPNDQTYARPDENIALVASAEHTL
jgi:seryl-tRNA synthetase